MDHVLSVAPVHWDDLRRRSLLITGGTGFVGTWLLATFAWVNRALGLDATLTAVTRRPAAFAARAPGVAGDPAITLVEGDVSRVELQGPFDFVIHAASQEPVGPVGRRAPGEGTRRTSPVRDTSSRSRAAPAPSRVLFTSSGAVYGVQPPELALVEEDYDGASRPA